MRGEGGRGQGSGVRGRVSGFRGQRSGCSVEGARSKVKSVGCRV